MAASFNRRTKVLLALVVSMTLGAGILMVLAPAPGERADAVQLTGQSDYPAPQPTDQFLAHQTRLANWNRVVIHRLANDRKADDYHFVVGPDARIRSTARWNMQQASASDQRREDQRPDIHVAIASSFDQSPLTSAQLEQIHALQRLAHDLADYLELTSDHFVLHSQSGPAACPGPAFPRDWATRATY